MTKHSGTSISEACPEMPLVSIIIVSYNGGDFLLNCLNSVLKTDYPNYEIIVVDNGSTDGSIEIIKQKFKKIKIIENGKNLGFSIGNNIGIRSSCGDYIVLLNQDTIVTKNWLKELVKEAKRHGEGFYNPKILLIDNPKLLDSAGNNLHITGIAMPRGLYEADRGQYNKFEEIAYANGTCVLLPKTTLQIVGLLDPVYFAYGEDVDWSWRGRMLGIKSYYVPSATIYHKHSLNWGRLSKRKLYFVERNRLLTNLKNYSKRTLLLLSPIFVIVEVAILTHAFINGWLPEKIKAYLDLIRLRTYIRQQRNFLQKKRRIPDKEIIRVFSDKIDHPFLKHPAIGVLNHILKPLTRIIRQCIK
jgi:GT2 family glycosyltransferase